MLRSEELYIEIFLLKIYLSCIYNTKFMDDRVDNGIISYPKHSRPKNKNLGAVKRKLH